MDHPVWHTDGEWYSVTSQYNCTCKYRTTTSYPDRVTLFYHDACNSAPHVKGLYHDAHPSAYPGLYRHV